MTEKAPLALGLPGLANRAAFRDVVERAQNGQLGDPNRGQSTAETSHADPAVVAHGAGEVASQGFGVETEWLHSPLSDKALDQTTANLGTTGAEQPPFSMPPAEIPKPAGTNIGPGTVSAEAAVVSHLQ